MLTQAICNLLKKNMWILVPKHNSTGSTNPEMYSPVWLHMNRNIPFQLRAHEIQIYSASDFIRTTWTKTFVVDHLIYMTMQSGLYVSICNS